MLIRIHADPGTLAASLVAGAGAARTVSGAFGAKAQDDALRQQNKLDQLQTDRELKEVKRQNAALSSRQRAKIAATGGDTAGIQESIILGEQAVKNATSEFRIRADREFRSTANQANRATARGSILPGLVFGFAGAAGQGFATKAAIGGKPLTTDGD